jgi:hypothetical protein
VKNLRKKSAKICGKICENLREKICGKTCGKICGKICGNTFDLKNIQKLMDHPLLTLCTNLGDSQYIMQYAHREAGRFFLILNFHFSPHFNME